MRKTIYIAVKINLSEEVSDEEETNIAENVIGSLMHTVRTAGITSDSEENAYTKSIEVEGRNISFTGDVKTGKIETV